MQQGSAAPRLSMKWMAGASAWLFASQALAMFAPLVSFPILARALGVLRFSEYAVVTASAATTLIFIDFGLNLTAARAAAQNIGDRNEQGSILASVIFAKIALAILCVPGFFSLLLFSHVRSAASAWPWLIYLGTVLASLSPTWALTARGEGRTVAIVIGLPKVLLAAACMTLVRRPEDIILAAAATLIANSAGLVIAIRRLSVSGVRAVGGSLTQMKRLMSQSVFVFSSMLGANLYTTANVILVTSLLGTQSGGLFAAADRIRTATTSLTSPISTLLYPALCRLEHFGGDQQELRTKRLLFACILLVGLGSSLMLFGFPELLVRLLAGTEFVQSAPVLRALAPAPLLIAGSTILGTHTLLPQKRERAFAMVLNLGALIGVVSMALLSARFGLLGSAASIVLTEGAVTATMFALVTLHTRRKPKC